MTTSTADALAARNAAASKLWKLETDWATLKAAVTTAGITDSGVLAAVAAVDDDLPKLHNKLDQCDIYASGDYGYVRTQSGGGVKT